VHSGQMEQGGEGDILARLWEEVPFARLPVDAPVELKEYLQDVENPKRIYAIHRASRRHDFQLLVERYITQLRNGCGTTTCATSTCFSCRRRLVGSGPIRRYNPTSARTLAVYLASQDNPEHGLCPNLRPPKRPPAARESLLFLERLPSYDESVLGPSVRGNRRTHRNILGAKSPPSRKGSESRHDAGNGGPTRKQSGDIVQEHQNTAPSVTPKFMVHDRVTSKDYRSFAANVFGTVAFKMLEWLTPNSVESMFKEAAEYQGKGAAPEPETVPTSLKPQEYKGDETETSTSSRSPIHTPTSSQDSEKGPGQENAAYPPRDIGPTVAQDKLPPAPKPSKSRRNSNARVRTSSTSKTTRTVSVEPFPTPTTSEDIAPGLVSPRLGNLQADKVLRGPKSTQPGTTRSIPEIPTTPGFFDHVKTIQQPSRVDIKTKHEKEQVVEISKPVAKKQAQPPDQRTDKRSIEKTQEGEVPEESAPLPASVHDNLLPQSLSRLTPEIVDLLCDILQDDGTLESRDLAPERIAVFPTVSNRPRYLERKRARHPYPQRMKVQWKQFIEQSLFSVLSDPNALAESFTRDGQLFDSQSIWYCMLRLTRVVPSLLFDSLWIAAARLFGPPKSLHSLQSPTTKVFRQPENSLSNSDAGRVIAICLHALVAAAPLAVEAQEILDVSRIRSGGRSLAPSGAGGRQPSWVCVQYEDAFSNDLALRLARRLFSAITARQRFAEMVEQTDPFNDSAQDLDVLQPLLALMDFLNADKHVLDFPAPHRQVHETRVPIILLDWARTVMLEEWDGSPEFSGNGPYGGALSLIAALCELSPQSLAFRALRADLFVDQRRKSLLLGDIQFRIDYFADRLDSIDMPVAWLSFPSTRQKAHLLDHPYIFNPDTLVSYFRSINFSRMSRTYEESSSLQTRMNAIVAPESLITNVNHKRVLQDLLETASCKYLILGISRENVIHDAFNQLWQREERELLRPLKVHLGEDSGEEGFDSGGVQQEFFRMAIAECLNPNYGAFTVDDRTRMAWFVPGSAVETWKFELVGLLVSLAVYNGLTLPITFPKALYRKLLGEPVNEIHDIDDGWPDLASGLETLLEWNEKDGLVEDVFMRTYEFSVSVFDQPISREMNDSDQCWPQFASSEEPLSAGNPPDAPLVTNENRNAYVTDYIKYLTDVSIAPQFQAFERGFRTCLHPKSLHLLNSTILQSVVEGVQEIDVSELRRYARYVGWDPSHRTIKDFWSIVKRYDERMKRRLLEFVTASDRVPVGGMKNLQFVIQRNGEEEGEGGHLPTAYTCYGTLLLPEYRDKDVLRERLAMALENAQGFGFA
jgi:hypothetical protein